MFGDSTPASGALVLSENMDILGDAAPQAIYSSVGLTSNPSPLVANESGALTLTVVSSQNVLSPLIEVPIEGFTFANGTITEDGAPVSYEVLNSSVSDDSASIYIEPDHWLGGSTYNYVFDITPTNPGTLGFQLRFRPLYDETNVTLSEKSLTVTGRGDVAVQVTDEDTNPVVATIVLDGQSQTASAYTFTDLLEGSYSLSVSKDGYNTVSTTVSVAANEQTNVTVSMPTDLTTPQLILSQGSGALGGVSSVPGELSAAFAENATYNVTLVGNGGTMGIALEFPERLMFHDPVITLNGAVLDPSAYEIRNGTFAYHGSSAYTTTNATLIVYDAPNGVNEIGISLGGTVWGEAKVDGKITSTDALFILQYAVGVKSSLDTFDYADVHNRDQHKITSTDAMYVLQKAVKVRNDDYTL
jgi:hypothetical protein